MRKVVNIQKKVSHDNFNLWSKMLFNDLISWMLLVYPKVANDLMRGDYEKAITECEKMADSIHVYLAPLRLKAQEMRNRKYLKQRAKVIKIGRRN